MSETIKPIGHVAVLARLEGLCSAARQRAYEGVHHAYIFSGPAGVGKWKTARWWAMRLKCEDPGACRDDCGSCRQIVAGSHPDVSVCLPDEKGQRIKIESVRELIRSMALRAQRRGPRVALIRDADALTTDAQNAMLRLLEEPPGTSIIVLVAANPSSLLATVRSRCQIVRFGVLSNAEIVELVTAAGKPAAIAEQAAAVAHGRGARALAYGPEALAERATLIGEFEALRGDRHADIEALVSKMADKKNPRDEWLEMLFEWQMTKIKASVGYQVSETDPGLRDLLDSVDGRQTRRLIDEACRINATRRAVAAQANVKLAMRELLLDIRD